MPIRIKVANSDAEFAQLFELRYRCFRKDPEPDAPFDADEERTSSILPPQPAHAMGGRGVQEFVDAIDAYPTTFHVVCLVGQKVVAGVRVSKLSSVGTLPDDQDEFVRLLSVGPNVQPYTLAMMCVDEEYGADLPLCRYLISNAARWATVRGASHIYGTFETPFDVVAEQEQFEQIGEAAKHPLKNSAIRRMALEVTETPERLTAVGEFGELDLGDPLERIIYHRDEEIIKQSERGYCAYVMTRGIADVVVEDGNGGETQVATLGQGALFGELALLADTRRSATVKAQRECEVLRVTPAVFRNYIRTSRDNAEKVIGLLGRRQQAQLAGLVQQKPSQDRTRNMPRSRDPSVAARPEGSIYQSLLRGRSSNTILFGTDEMQDWLGIHREIATEYGLLAPYFNKTKNTQAFSKYSTERFMTTDIPGLEEIGFVAGPLEAFSDEFMAAFTASQLTAYVDRGAIGSLPRFAPYMRDLTAAHLEGFDESNQLISFVARNPQGQIVPLVGAKLVRGKTSRILTDINGDSGATLPTFTALRVIDPVFDEAEGQIQEDEVVCLSSYFSGDFRQLGVKSRGVIMLAELLISMAGLVMDEDAERSGKLIKRALFDTHIDALVRKYQREFGAVYTASGDQVITTPAVTDPQTLGGILRFHYGPREMGGYDGRIHVVLVDSQKYREGGEAHLRKFQKRFKTGSIIE